MIQGEAALGAGRASDRARLLARAPEAPAEAVTPCFTLGTLIATEGGTRPVEALRPGDRVLTRDDGAQPIRWLGVRALEPAELAQSRDLVPVTIRAGALGNDLPGRDLTVSPNHRVLIAGGRSALYYHEREVLVAAKHLVDGRGVRWATPLGATYLHFMFDRHQAVLSNGAWTESFQPDDRSLKGIGKAQRAEILALFPDLAKVAGRDAYVAARPVLSGAEIRRLFH